jgi:hypothetical protein
MSAYPKDFIHGYSDDERPLVFYAEGPWGERVELMSLEAARLMMKTLMLVGTSGRYRVIDSRGKVHEAVAYNGLPNLG